MEPTTTEANGVTAMTQTITKNPSGDLCQHGAYADLCITCHAADCLGCEQGPDHIHMTAEDGPRETCCAHTFETEAAR
jgi:hypothetical protein